MARGCTLPSVPSARTPAWSAQNGFDTSWPSSSCPYGLPARAVATGSSVAVASTSTVALPCHDQRAPSACRAAYSRRPSGASSAV